MPHITRNSKHIALDNHLFDQHTIKSIIPYLNDEDSVKHGIIVEQIIFLFLPAGNETALYMIY